MLKKEESMSLKPRYDNVADSYTTASDHFGAISLSHECAIRQIVNAGFDFPPPYKILDLGVGNGAFLQKLQVHFPESHFTGIDISAEMLKLAQKALSSLVTIKASAADVSQFLPQNSQDLVLAHFLNAYVPSEQLFNQAYLLTSSNHYFSMITTTYDSFRSGQLQLDQFCSKKLLLNRIVNRYYKTVIQNTTVAQNEHELMQLFSDHQFDIVDHQRLTISITFDNIDDLFLFGIEGGWFLNGIPSTFLPKKFIRWIWRLVVCKIITFPYKDIHVIDVVLARKRAS